MGWTDLEIGLAAIVAMIVGGWIGSVIYGQILRIPLARRINRRTHEWGWRIARGGSVRGAPTRRVS